MFKKLVCLSVSVFLAGCQTSNVGMKLEQPDKQGITLLGATQIKRGLHSISVSNGELSCSGSGDMKPVGLYRFEQNIANLKCSDGRTGSLKLQLKGSLLNPEGYGIGRLNDGTKLKIIVGDLSASIDW